METMSLRNQEYVLHQEDVAVYFETNRENFHELPIVVSRWGGPPLISGMTDRVWVCTQCKHVQTDCVNFPGFDWCGVGGALTRGGMWKATARAAWQVHGL